MKITFYAKLYALPISIICIGFLAYYFVFDSLNQYQQHVITITQPETPRNNDTTDEKARIREELEKIKQSSNADFIHSTLSQNLNRMSAYANIEFDDTKTIAQTELKQKQDNTTRNHSTIEIKKPNSIEYVPYRQIHTHELPNAFITNPNTATNIKLNSTNNPFDVKTIQITQEDKKSRWVIPTTKEARIYHAPDIQTKVIAINKNGMRMQVIGINKSWVHVRYAIRKEIIDGYIPMKNIRFVQPINQ